MIQGEKTTIIFNYPFRERLRRWVYYLLRGKAPLKKRVKRFLSGYIPISENAR